MGDYGLSDDDRRVIDNALRRWVAGHPNPQTPFVLVSGYVLTPEQLADEMRKNTTLGRPFLEYLADVAQRTDRPIDEPIYRAIEGNLRR